jgi:beta-lactamase class A
MSKNFKRIILQLFLFTIIFFAGFFTSSSINNSQNCVSSKFEHINPKLKCMQKYVVNKSNYIKLKNDLENMIATKIAEKKADNVSIYFRDLINGPTMGIDEHIQFSPASLLKLPLLITYLRINEDRHDNFLDRKIAFPKIEDYSEQFFSPKALIQEDVEYSIDDLLRRMIKYSDNRAYFGLLKYLSIASPKEDLLLETDVDLGIVDPKNDYDQTVTVKSYAGIFTQLFHSSFFNKQETSEKALSILSDTDFNDGIIKGVPKNLKVAHKFGERSDLPNNKKQLHDCGIVYYPKNPYLICIMTRGNDFNDLTKIIQDLSGVIYKEFDSRKL